MGKPGVWWSTRLSPPVSGAGQRSSGMPHRSGTRKRNRLGAWIRRLGPIGGPDVRSVPGSGPSSDDGRAREDADPAIQPARRGRRYLAGGEICDPRREIVVIRVGLLDTTVVGAPGSMPRFREQLERAFSQHATESVEVETLFLGTSRDIFRRTPSRLRMYRHHFHCWRSARRLDVSRFDVLHLLDGSFGYVADAVGNRRVLVTVHDVIPKLQMVGRFSGGSADRSRREMAHRSIAGVDRPSREGVRGQSEHCRRLEAVRLSTAGRHHRGSACDRTRSL